MWKNDALNLQSLVKALTDLAKEKGWEFNEVYAERMSQEEQLRLMAKTTVSL